MELNKKLFRHFTKDLKENESVYDMFKWKKVNVIIKNHKTGEIITKQKDLEFPEHYSQNACDIIASKYFRLKDDDKDMETSMRDIVHRMVFFWVNALLDEKLIEEDLKNVLYDELAYSLLSQMWAPNSPQWFNTGLKHSYNLSGKKQGHFYYDEETKQVHSSEDSYTRTQGSACFIVSIEDTLVGEKSLSDQLVTETLLFKYGSGVGTNWSPIRAINEKLSGGGKSSGLLSFLKVSDKNAGAIKSGGTTRRAAKMNILDVDHPEILEFINWKAHEEDKVIALTKMGYDNSIDGEAYETVSGQNVNNSVRVKNDFMNSINNDVNIKLKGRVDSSIDKDIAAKQIWDELAYATWRCGDPGLQFDDTINQWHTCPAGEDGSVWAPHNRINASNPCSEYMFLDDTACNLASINIEKFYDTDKNIFDTATFVHTVKIVQLVLEATIHFGQFPTKDIARKSHMFRTTGLGLTNFASLFMQMGLPYDSDEARTIAGTITSLMTGYSYLTSSWMAEKIGAFDAYNKNSNYMLDVIHNHSVVAGYDEKNIGFKNLSYEPFKVNHNILKDLGFEILSDVLKRCWQDCLQCGHKFGYRNAQTTVLAPTGTISFAMDCASTSSEPFFSHVVYKKLVGGGFMEIINPYIPAALKKLGYNQNESDEIVNYVLRKKTIDNVEFLIDGKIEGAPFLKQEHYNVFDTASTCGTGDRFISWEGHVNMMAALSPNVSGAISKTVNLPSSGTVEDIKDVFESSWRLGVKAIAIYRDGCKSTQPLNSQKTKNKSGNIDDLSYKELLNFAKSKENTSAPSRKKPSGIRKARVHEANINGLKLYITTSFYDDGRLGEVYVSSGRQGSLTKGLLDSLSTTISKMLQYGLPAEDIARMYRGQKYEPSGLVGNHPYIKSVDSISDLISKIIDIELGNFTYCQVKPDDYIEPINNNMIINKDSYNANDYIYGSVCPNCQSLKMVRNGTCKVCIECGTTTGCS